MTVAKGMGGEGRGVGSSQRSYDRWALGKGGGGRGEEEMEGGWVGAGPARGVGEGERGEEESEGGPRWGWGQ